MRQTSESDGRTGPTCAAAPEEATREGDVAAAEDWMSVPPEQLLALQRLAALGELIGTTTHEFNNILMTIMNYARMGLRHDDPSTRQKCLEKILNCTQRAAKITGTILGMARNRSQDAEPTNLSQLINDTLLLLERELNKYRVRVERRFNAVPPVLVNGNQLQQVLLNLLTNARQAMPNGGVVRVSLDYEPQEQMVVLTIRDYGCGIPPDQLPHIFKPFFTTKRGPDSTGKGGTGLGLAACRQIIEAHRGRIRVQSSPGKGTAFAIKLPAAPGTVAPQAEDAQEAGTTG